MCLVLICCKEETRHKQPWFVSQNMSGTLAYKAVFLRLTFLSSRALAVRDGDEEVARVTSYRDMEHRVGLYLSVHHLQLSMNSTSQRCLKHKTHSLFYKITFY